MRYLLLAVSFLVGGSIAQANTFTFLLAGQAQATFTTGANSISITLTDLFANPTDVADNLSALIFATSVTPTTHSIASSGSGGTVTVNSGGSYTTGGSVAPGWAIALSGATTTLDDLVAGASGPGQTIIGAPGPGGYTNANGSIAGNGPHNPFLNQTATWTLTENGVTSATSISNVIFQFGTTDGSNRSAGTLVATPEPSALALIGLGFAFIGIRKLPIRSKR